MTTTIGAVTLDNDPIWKNYGVRQDITAERYIGMDGTENVVERIRVCGYPIDLVMTKSTGWITGTTLTALRALADDLGWKDDLVYRGHTYEVRFRHEEGAIEVEPLDERRDPTTAACLFIGTIRLMTV